MDQEVSALDSSLADLAVAVAVAVVLGLHISGKRAQVFNAMAATTCAPLTVPAPCIPFLYPDDGCWARAHEMARLMQNMGLKPRKVWIQGWPLNPDTRNHPNCEVTLGLARGPNAVCACQMVVVLGHTQGDRSRAVHNTRVQGHVEKCPEKPKCNADRY